MAHRFQQEARQGYYGAVSFTDSEVGRVLDTLDDLALWNSTVVALWVRTRTHQHCPWLTFVVGKQGDHGWQLGGETYCFCATRGQLAH